MRCKFVILLFAALLWTTFSGWTDEVQKRLPENYLQEITERFTPSKPTVRMLYDAHYRFLALNLMQVAVATIETTEGMWHAPGKNRDMPCALIDVTIQSPSAAKNHDRAGRMYIHDRIISVVTMPELDTLYYLKMTDELLHPIFGARKDIQNFHVYDLSSGELDFYAYDILKGKAITNIQGAVDMAAQGREVSRVLTLLSDVYYKRCAPICPDSDFRIFVNCDGKAIPFAAESSRADVKAFGGQYDALRVDVVLAREAPHDIPTRDFTVWATSFTEVASRTESQALQKIAEETPAWGMTPLLANYGMAIGSIRLSLIDISARNNDTAWFTTPSLTLFRPHYSY